MTETALLNLWAWSLQTGLLAVAAGVLMRIIVLDAPTARYAWWRGVLVVCLALPVIQPWQPLGLSPIAAVGPAASTSPALATPVAAAAMTPAIASVPPGTASGWPVIVATVLVIGALARLAWLAAGLIRLRRTRRAGIVVDAADGPDSLHALIAAGADVRQVASLRQPVTFGLVRPVVLLPGTFQSLPPGVQRAVLAHELWHVRRRDWIWSLTEETLRAVFWFHPAIGYLVSQVQGAREEVVDELSILSTNSRRSYLEALLTFADEPAVHPAAPFARRRQLFNRMMLISKEAVMSSRRIVVSTAGMAGVLVLTGWYTTLAFPLTDPGGGAVSVEAGEAQAPSTPGSREALLSRARVHLADGQFDEAMALLETVAAQNPMDPAGHQLVATHYWEKAQKDQKLTLPDKLMYIEKGIQATDYALAQQPDYVAALTYKNILLRMKGNLETDATRRRQLYTEADALRTRALALSKQGTGYTAPPDRSASAPPPPPPPPPPHPAQHNMIDGQRAIRVGGAVKPPAKIHHVDPVYPAKATDIGRPGEVIIEIAIDTQGVVRSTFVKRTNPALAQAAIDAVRQWRFAPTVQDGVAVPVLMTVAVRFP